MALVESQDAELDWAADAAAAPGYHLVPTVPEALRVTHDQLIQWAKSAGVDRELPRLIRRLIAETEPSATWIDMPAGTGVAAPGWDGVVRCSDGNRFVPAGRSTWELSTEQAKSQRKASADYDRRVNDTPRAERAQMAYVAVVCAPWTKARSLARERSQRCDFRLVQALNADGIQDWLECAPVTIMWLREKMGEPEAGVGLLSSCWSLWLASTKIPLDADIVLAGRRVQADKLRDGCGERRGGIVTVGGDVRRDEILAFIAAVLVAQVPAVSSGGDVLYVDDHASAQRLLASEALGDSSRPRVNSAGMTVVVPSTDFAEHLPPDSVDQLIVPAPGSDQAAIVLGNYIA